jgi:hypothetical protein
MEIEYPSKRPRASDFSKISENILSSNWNNNNLVLDVVLAYLNDETEWGKESIFSSSGWLKSVVDKQKRKKESGLVNVNSNWYLLHHYNTIARKHQKYLVNHTSAICRRKGHAKLNMKQLTFIHKLFRALLNTFQINSSNFPRHSLPFIRSMYEYFERYWWSKFFINLTEACSKHHVLMTGGSTLDKLIH